jgi:hypothetical protein
MKSENLKRQCHLRGLIISEKCVIGLVCMRMECIEVSHGRSQWRAHENRTMNTLLALNSGLWNFLAKCRIQLSRRNMLHDVKLCVLIIWYLFIISNG